MKLIRINKNRKNYYERGLFFGQMFAKYIGAFYTAIRIENYPRYKTFRFDICWQR